MQKKAVLLLEDGFFQEGFSFGADVESIGEVVFNTSMTGYQEILTDPSYRGQIVCMTYPLIGNYGVNPDDIESRKIFADGFIVKEESRIFSNWRGVKSLREYLGENNIPAIQGIDTRALTIRLRTTGSMKGIISTGDFHQDSLLAKLKQFPSILGRDLVQEVTVQKAYQWQSSRFPSESAGNHTAVVVDCGVKHSILHHLKRFFKTVWVVPPASSLNEIMRFNPRAIIFSNGPGDPSAVENAIRLAREFIQKLQAKELNVVLFGICLGHQILGLAFGGKTYKLKFGHHGGNHPVKDLRSGKIDITAQNHNFCVDMASLPEELEMTHVNLYDHTPEGMRHKRLPVFSVQFHPEAGPGPFDAGHIFAQLQTIINDKKVYDHA